MYNDFAQEAPATFAAGVPASLHNGQSDHSFGLVTPRREKQGPAYTAKLHKRKTGLRDLPVELLLKIKDCFTELSDHAAFWALCPDSAGLYTDDQFRDLCLRANIARPKIWADQSWAEIAGTVTKHLSECLLCHRYMHDATLSSNESARQVYEKAGDAPWISVISNLRQSAGRYSINWTQKKLQDRPELILASFTPTQEEASILQHNAETVDPKLIQHPAMACRLAFIQPIRSVKCGFESDSVWQFGKAGQLVKTHGRSASYHELNARAAQAEEYRSECYNADGITVLDLLLAASDTPEIPTDGLTGLPLVFAGILDDTLRGQDTIWVHATCQPEETSAAGTPSYAFARDHGPSTSMDWGKLAEISYGLFDPLINSYGYIVEVK